MNICGHVPPPQKKLLAPVFGTGSLGAPVVSPSPPSDEAWSASFCLPCFWSMQAEELSHTGMVQPFKDQSRSYYQINTESGHALLGHLYVRRWCQRGWSSSSSERLLSGTAVAHSSDIGWRILLGGQSHLCPKKHLK